MAALSTHLRASNHAALAFHPGCPVCRAERLSGALTDGPVISLRAQAAGLVATLALVPALTAAPALATDNETTVGIQDPGKPVDNVDDPNFKLPPANKAPLRDGAPVVNPDAPTNDKEGDPLDNNGDPGDDPGAQTPAPGGINDNAVPPGPTPDQTPPPAPTPPPPPAFAPPAATPAPLPPASPAPAPAPPAVPQPAPVAKPKPAAKKPAKPKARRKVAERPKQRAAPPTTAAPAVRTPQPQAPVAAPVQRPAAQPVAATRPVAAPTGRTYTVRSGDSLWSIASRVAGPGASPAKIAALVDQLWKLNSSRIASGDPSMVAVGTALQLP